MENSKNMKKIWGVIRTKGKAPYLKQILDTALNNLDGVVLVDNNPTPTHNYEHINLIYKHDSREIIPMCSEQQLKLNNTGDHWHKNSLASFYRDSFECAPQGSWRVKLDDDDAWDKNQWQKLRKQIENVTDESIIYFSGVNWLGCNLVSKTKPICGGRDHFAIGPKCKIEWENGKMWEELKLKNNIKKFYIGIKYIHLKFYGHSVGYEKDIEETNKELLLSLHNAFTNGIAISSINQPLLYKFLEKLNWKLLPNAWLGCSELEEFWNETRVLRMTLDKTII